MKIIYDYYLIHSQKYKHRCFRIELKTAACSRTRECHIVYCCSPAGRASALCFGTRRMSFCTLVEYAGLLGLEFNIKPIVTVNRYHSLTLTRTKYGSNQMICEINSRIVRRSCVKHADGVGTRRI